MVDGRLNTRLAVARSRALPRARARRLLLIVAVAGACWLVACGTGNGPAQPEAVNFYNWSDYIADDVLPSFTRETGIEVNYDVYDSNDVLEGKLLAGNSGYDLVVPSNGYFEVQSRAGLFRPFDKAQIPNLGNLDPRVMAVVAAMDPDNAYAVPYAWGTTGIGVNVGMVRARLPGVDLDSWALLFEPDNARALADCGLALLDAPDELHDILLNYLGFDPNSNDLGHLRRALDVVGPIRPYVRYFHSSQYIDDLANGEICVSMGWSGDVYQAIAAADDGVEITYVVPREGTNLWFDLMAVPADAPNPTNAYRLINYLLEPEVAAAISNFTWYAVPNVAAMPLVDPEVRDDPAIYLPRERFEAMFVTRARPRDVTRARNRLWARLKSGT